MKTINVQAIPGWAWGAAGAAVVAFSIYAVARKPKTRADGKEISMAEEIGGGLVTTAVDVVDGVVSAVVKGIGAVIGVPDTDAELCEKAKREGELTAASFYCPASDFFGHVFSGTKPAAKPATKPATKPAGSGTAYPSNRPGVITESGDCGITGLLCGPSFESDSRSWASELAIWQTPTTDATSGILRPISITPIAGLRG
jgi:hypothetical protein